MQTRRTIRKRVATALTGFLALFGLLALAAPPATATQGNDSADFALAAEAIANVSCDVAIGGLTHGYQGVAVDLAGNTRYNTEWYLVSTTDEK